MNIIKTTKWIVNKWYLNNKINKQSRWALVEEQKKELDNMINDIELAGYDNEIDEAYYRALVNVKDVLFGE